MTIELVGEWPQPLVEAVAKVADVLDERLDLEFPEGAVNLKLVDDAEIATLNELYSGNAYVTDVLTFVYTEDGENDGEVADIAISLETAAEQAKAAGTQLSDEIGLLALHGILHAIGLDHQTEQQQRRIEKLQSEILKRANITYREFKWKH